MRVYLSIWNYSNFLSVTFHITSAFKTLNYLNFLHFLGEIFLF